MKNLYDLNKSKIVKSLTVIGLVGILVGCSPKPENFVEGTVLKEYGNVARVVDSTGALFGNDSVKLGNPHYGLLVKTSEGNYTIEVDVTDRSGSSGQKTAYNLAMAIEEGTNIRFPTSFDGDSNTENPIGFTKDRIGFIDPDDIEILK